MSTRKGAESTLTFLPDGPTIEVPDDPEAERSAVAAHPHFQRLLAESRARRERGELGAPIEEYMARHAISPAPSRRLTGRRSTTADGKVSLRLPAELHRELIAQAERQGVSLNTLMVAYLAREAGVQATRGE